MFPAEAAVPLWLDSDRATATQSAAKTKIAVASRTHRLDAMFRWSDTRLSLFLIPATKNDEGYDSSRENSNNAVGKGHIARLCHG